MQQRASPLGKRELWPSWELCAQTAAHCQRGLLARWQGVESILRMASRNSAVGWGDCETSKRKGRRTCSDRCPVRDLDLEVIYKEVGRHVQTALLAEACL
jgi:hypothetical protein